MATTAVAASKLLRRELRALYKLAPTKPIEAILDSFSLLDAQQDPIIELFCDAIKLKNVDVSTQALVSLKLFIERNIVSAKTLQLITEAVTKIEFTSTNSTLIEEGYDRALDVCNAMIKCQKSHELTNGSVSEIIILCFRVLKSKLVKWLRRKAATTVMSITRRLFRRLSDFPDDLYLKPSYQICLRLGGASSQSAFKELADQQANANSSLPLSSNSNNNNNNNHQLNSKNSNNNTTISTNAPNDGTAAISTLRIIRERNQPYNLALINDFYSYLGTLINPDVDDNLKVMEAKVVLGLQLLTTVFEEAGHEIGQKSSLLHISRNSICYYIVTILKTNKSLPILSLTLNLASDLFIKIRHHLKYQFEEFLERLMDMLISSPESLELSPKSVIEVRSDALETVLELFRNIKNFAHELYYNYDCDPYSSNVYESLVQICSKNCFQHNSAMLSTFTPIQLTSFNCLLINLNEMYTADKNGELRLVPSTELASDEAKNYFPSTSKEINDAKRRKRLLWLAIEKFNGKAKEGVKFLYENNLIVGDYRLVDFLKDNIKIDKKQLGEFLSREENKSVRETFIRSLDFKTLRIDEALRMMLMKFRLPGESQLIERILDTFSSHWFEQNKDILKNPDEALSLSYAIIMLNVDQHSKKVKPMTCDEFDRNLLGPKSDRIYNRKLIDQIYTSIRDNEIVLPDEQSGEVKQRYLWKCVMVKSERLNSLYWITNGPPQTNRTKSIVMAADESVMLPDATVLVISSDDIPLNEMNKILFDVIWSPTVAAMTFIFDKIDTSVYSELPKQVIDNGFLKCADLCAKHGHLDNLVVSLCKFTTNMGPVPCQSISDKNSLAALCLLFIVRDHANSLCESWSNVIRNILQWYCSKLLDNIIEIDDFALQRKVRLSMRDIKKQPSTMNQQNSTFLQSVYSYFAGQQQLQAQASNPAANSRSEQQLAVGEAPYGDTVAASPSTVALLPSNLEDENLAVSTIAAATASPKSKYSSLKGVNISLVEVIKNSEYRSMESLNELITALTTASIDCDAEEVEDAEVLKLELFTQVVLTNHNLIPAIWSKVTSYFLRLCSICGPSQWLGERIISASFRIAIAFIHKQGFCVKIFQLLSHIITHLEPDIVRGDHTFLALITFTVTPETQSPLSSLTPQQLEACFNQLIFPFLDRICEQTENCEQAKLNKFLNRAANLLSKIFLKHLQALITLQTFAPFWYSVLETMDRFVKCSNGDSQFKEAIFELVKNMVLVMDHNECLSVEMKDVTRTKFMFWGVQSELDY